MERAIRVSSKLHSAIRFMLTCEIVMTSYHMNERVTFTEIIIKTGFTLNGSGVA